MPDYNPDSIDAVLARFESKFDSHVSSTQQYRQSLDAKLEKHNERISDLEGDRKKVFGIAIGSGIGAGGFATALSKFFGSSQ